MSRSPGGYAALGSDEQVALLRGVAHAGAAAFGLDVHELALVRHEFNTTFRVVDAEGRSVAVRVHTNSVSTPEHLVAQHAWMRALASETGLRLPVPLRTVDGAEHTLVTTPHGAFVVVMASWLDGEDVGECDVVQAGALGRAMAKIHAHAEGWTMPFDGRLSAFTDPLFGDEDLLSDTLRDPPEEAALVGWALRSCEEAILEAQRLSPPIVVHGDLHGGNLTWHRGELAVFDFDDCGVAAPALDLAIATFCLRGSEPEVDSALRAGYSEVRRLPEVSTTVFEALVASRTICSRAAPSTSGPRPTGIWSGR